MDDAIRLVWLLLHALHRWYIILFSRLDYEVIGTTGIIIQEMNVIQILWMMQYLHVCYSPCLCCWIDVNTYCIDISI